MENQDKSEVVKRFEAIIKGGNARGQRTRIEIIEQAAQAFSESGFHGTSLRSIARSSGIDHSTLKHHFANKEELLAAVLRWRDWHGLQEWVDADLDGDADARTIAYSMGEQARRNHEATTLTQLYSVLSAEAGQEGHPAREYLQERQEAFVSLLERTISERGVEQRLAASRLSARDLAVLMACAWDGMQVYDALNPGALDISKMVRTLAELVLGVEEDEGEGSDADQETSDPRDQDKG